MTMKKYFPLSVKTALVLVYLVIVAGALVRMTGSGMGCPDWPKCFGYYIPPTDEKELLFDQNKEFQKGQVIIYEEKLWVAKTDFTTSQSFNESDWDVYTKHDYAIFNVYHTWTEYLNRLCGALAGIACLVMAILSFAYWSEKKRVILLSWLVVFLMGFQAWLGATVVYSVLNPVKITVHMVMALVIVAVILYILQLVQPKTSTAKSDKLFSKLLWVSLVFSLIQIVLGTQVRQFVDEQIKHLGYDNMHMIFAEPPVNFYFHRTFTFVVLGTAIYMYIRNRKLSLGFSLMNWVMILFGIEILSGIAMYYLDFPFGMQTTHLVVASILFGLQFYMILQNRNIKSLLV
jgi:cytochrome c oxidase assembly protein subunit 15